MQSYLVLLVVYAAAIFVLGSVQTVLRGTVCASASEEPNAVQHKLARTSALDLIIMTSPLELKS
jgi:hypothetical protein